MRDPYEVLGVSKNASAKDIKAAYRKLAKKHHPDQNPDDSKAKDRFAQANQAYEILGDEKQRAAFDRGEIDAEGKPRFQGFEGFHPGAGAGGDPFAGFRRQQAGPGGAVSASSSARQAIHSPAARAPTSSPSSSARPFRSAEDPVARGAVLATRRRAATSTSRWTSPSRRRPPPRRSLLSSLTAAGSRSSCRPLSRTARRSG